jgi:prepilin-type N-terminal cleavage/methylation domain-containing protein
MKLSYKKQASGFTLIEMIGVLAVIAILAALLIPKIFEAINNARINNAAINVQTVKTAIADHYAKFGSLASSNGVPITAIPSVDYDVVLLQEGFIDKPFSTKLTATNDVQIVQGLAAAATPTGTDASYDLDGVGGNDAGPVTAVVVESVITGITANDAWELSKRIDGESLSETTPGTADLRGRVKYATPTANTEVHVYLTHR